MITSFKKEYAFLSNFYPSPFTAAWYNDFESEPIVWDTNEHYYQAGKATNINIARGLSMVSTPRKAKKHGRAIALRADWPDINLDVMVAGLRHKFSNERLRELLIATEEEPLIEGNDWGDTYWGRVWDNNTRSWIGQNHLGRCLEIVRAELIFCYTER